jgi:hypothetical protein
MMYGFGSKYEGLVFAKIEVKGIWLFLYIRSVAASISK